MQCFFCIITKKFLYKYNGPVYCMTKGGRGYSPNDMRSMAKNPNSSHHNAAMNNRSNQLNPNNPSYFSSRSNSTYRGFLDYGMNVVESKQIIVFSSGDKIVIDDDGAYSARINRSLDID
jgi:hypothetical protein